MSLGYSRSLLRGASGTVSAVSAQVTGVTSGQGRGRTADLPLFRIKDHRPSAATLVALPAQRPSLHCRRCTCTGVDETQTETLCGPLRCSSPGPSAAASSDGISCSPVASRKAGTLSIALDPEPCLCRAGYRSAPGARAGGTETARPRGWAPQQAWDDDQIDRPRRTVHGRRVAQPPICASGVCSLIASQGAPTDRSVRWHRPDLPR